jgi:hypothetical protein
MAYALRQGTDGRLAKFDAATPLESPGEVHILGQNELRFYEGVNYVGFEAPALTGNQIWVLPATDSTGTQYLTSDGAGNLGWATPGGTGDVTGPASSLDNQIARFSGTTGKVIQAGTNAPTYDDSGNVILQNKDIRNAQTITFNGVGTGSGTGTADWTSYQKYEWTFAGSATLTFTAPQGPCNLVMLLSNGGAGTITWPSNVVWPKGQEPNWTAGLDLVSFYYDADATTPRYFGVGSLNFS